MKHNSFVMKQGNFIRRIKSYGFDLEEGAVQNWNEKNTVKYFKILINHSTFINQSETGVQNLRGTRKHQILKSNNDIRTFFEKAAGYMSHELNITDNVLEEITDYCIRVNNFSFLNYLIDNYGIDNDGIIRSTEIIVKTLLSYNTNIEQNFTKDFLINIKFDRFVQMLASSAKECTFRCKTFFAELIKSAKPNYLSEVL